MQRLQGKVALVTGAARGIGQGIALCLAEEGTNVIVNDLLPSAKTAPEDGQSTVESIKALGCQALLHYADVSDREQVNHMFAAGVAHFGHIDIVVANAAHSIRSLVVDAQWEDVLNTVKVTQFGVFHTCRMAAKQMLTQISQQRPGGKIIIIGSILAYVPLKNSAAYNMSKAATNQFGRTLANEVAEAHINVNIIGEAGKTPYASDRDERPMSFALPVLNPASPWRNPIELADAQDVYAWVSHQSRLDRHPWRA